MRDDGADERGKRSQQLMGKRKRRLKQFS